MESMPETKLKAESAQTLLWCCFCDARFERPALLSTHLDSYNVNWKLYWQLFYSRRDGKACVLCNILHADRKSLECHFKMVHCIAGPCAKREPEVITIEAGPSEEGLPKTPSEETAVDDASPDELCLPGSESEQEDPLPQVVRSDNIDDIDVLFEITHADAVVCETSSTTTPESLHLALPSTPSEAEQSPRPGEDVQVLPNSEENLPSPCRTSQSNVADNDGPFIPDGVDSAPVLTSSTTFAVLQSDDEVEELESDGLDLLSPSNSREEGELVASAARTDSGSRESPDVIKIEDDDAVIPVERLQQTGILPPSVDLPPTASFPAESRLTRPTAVVNPFGAHGERCSTLTGECERNIPGLPPSVVHSIPGPSQTITGQRSEQNSPIPETQTITGQRSEQNSHIPETLTSLGCDLIAVVQDDDNSDIDSHANAPALSCMDPLSGCRTPPHALGDVERELGENWPSRTVSTVGRDLPDLSRLTPSKIAAFMNKDVFSAKQQSDLEKHLDKKALAEPRSPIAKEPPPKTCTDTSSNQWEADSEGRRVSREDNASGVLQDSKSSEPHAADFGHSSLNSRSVTEPNLSSAEEEESLPFGFNIVSVESLLPKPLVCDQAREERETDKRSARVDENIRHSRKEAIKESSSGIRTKSKRTLDRISHDDAGTPTSSAMNKTEKEHELSPMRKKKSRTDDQNPGEMQLTSSGPKEVFKQPIGLCVGVIHPGSLVEVSTANVPRTSKARSSLDGMVMKVEVADSSIRYFIHFPNMDKRLDRWVSKEDIIQVYRTEPESTKQTASPIMTSSSPLEQAKRRLAFEPSPEAQRSESGSTTHSAHGKSGAAASVRPPRKRSHRPTIPAEGRAAGIDRRPRDWRGRLASVAKARLVQTRQQAKTTSRSQSQIAPRFRRSTKTGTRTGRTVKMKSGSSKLSLRPRRVPTAVSGTDISGVRDDDAAANANEPGTVSKRQNAQPVEPAPSGSDSAVSRSLSSKPTSTGGAKKSTGGNIIVSQASCLGSATGEAPEEGGTQQCASDVNAPTQTVSGAGAKTVPPNNGHAKTGKIRSQRLNKKPPAGVTIRPVVDSMLDSLRPGMLVYVICTVLPDGWLRLYAARITKVLDRERFYVHYLGFRRSHNEWISSELIHSIMDVQEMSKPKLQASWMVKSSEEMSPNEHEETTTTSVILEMDRKSEGESSSDSKHLKAVGNARGSHNVSKRVSPASRKGTGPPVRSSRIVPKPRHRSGGSQGSQKLAKRQHSPNPPIEAPPPVLSRECPARPPRDALAVAADVPPPNLSQEDDRPATRRKAAMGGHGEVNFWMSLADIHNDAPAQKVRTGSKPVAFNSATPDLPPASHAATLPVPLASSVATSAAGTDSVETATSEHPFASFTTGIGASATFRRAGKTPKKKLLKASLTYPPPLAGNGFQSSGSEAQSFGVGTLPVAERRSGRPMNRLAFQSAGSVTRQSDTEVPPFAKRRRGRPVKQAVVQPVSSVTQLAGTDVPSVAKRHRGRPKNTCRVASAAPLCTEPSTSPTGKPIDAKVPSVEKHSDLVLGQLRTAQPVAAGSCGKSDTADRPVDSGPLLCDSAVLSHSSAANPAIAVTPHPKRGRPFKKFKAAKLPSKDRERSASSAIQAADLQSHVADAKSAGPANPSDSSVASLTGSVVRVLAKPPGKMPKDLDASQPINKEREQSPSGELDDGWLQRRSLRSAAPAVTLKDAVQPAPLPPTSSLTTPAPAGSTAGRRNCTSDGLGQAPTDTIPRCTRKEIRRLKNGDVVYVVYEEKGDGSKFVYPTRILQVNKDLYYARFFIHYLGWAHRYDEWIADEVIYSIVDRSQPDFNVKSLKRHVVPSRGLGEQLSRVRPCSVDLSVNNICFFSALRNGRSSVDDKRIMALRVKGCRMNSR